MAQENNMMHKKPSDMDGMVAFTRTDLDSLPTAISQFSVLQTLPQRYQEYLNCCDLCSFKSLSQAEALAHLKNEHMVDEEEMKFFSDVDNNDMDTDPCSICAYCPFMTYSTDHLENHTKTNHHGMLPVSVSRVISRSVSTNVRKADATFHEALSVSNAVSSDTLLSYTASMEQTCLGLTQTLNNSVSVSQSVEAATSENNTLNMVYPVSSFIENVSICHTDEISLSEGEKESCKVVEMKDSIFPVTIERKGSEVESAVDNFISRNPGLENDIAGNPLFNMNSDFFSGKIEDDYLKTEEMSATEMDDCVKITPSQPHKVQMKGVNTTSRESKLKDLREASMKTLKTSNKSRITKFKSKDGKTKCIRNQCMKSSVRNQQLARHQRSLRQKRATWNHVENISDLNLPQKDSGFKPPCWKCFNKCVFKDDGTSVCQKAVKLKKGICGRRRRNKLTSGDLNLHKTRLRKSVSNLDAKGDTSSRLKSVHDMKGIGTTRKSDPQSASSANEFTGMLDNKNKLAAISPEEQTGKHQSQKDRDNINHREVGQTNVPEDLIFNDDKADYQINTDDLNSETSAFDKKQKGPFQCWLCFQNFEHCSEIKNHILDEHSSALWAIFEDFNAQPPLILFCPNNCEYSTFKSEELTHHIVTCQKLKLHNEGKTLLDVYNFISQEYVNLQQKISTGIIVDQRKKQKTSLQTRRSKSNSQQDFSNTSSFEDNEENESYEISLEKNTEDFALPSHQNLQTKGQETSATKRPLRVLHKCQRCSLAFSSTLSLEKHLQRQHSFEWQIVRKMKNNVHEEIRFDKDVTATPKKDLFKCDECNKEFTHSSQFCEHISRETGKKTFKCKECDRTFYRINYYNNHMKIHKPKLKTYKCNTCSKSFYFKSQLLLHSRSHSVKKPFKCVQCRKGFITKQYLRNHMKKHIDEKSFKCYECGQTFHEKIQLRIHRKKSHTGKKTFMCHPCGIRLVDKQSLVSHMKIHTNAKPFICNKCGKGLVTQIGLIRHMRMHTGKRPFKCNVCGRIFGKKIILQRHMLTHTGKKPFRCNQCDKHFNSRQNLIIHMRVHTGEKPFKCNYCGYSFSQKNNLQRHMITHTGKNKPFKCSQCGIDFLSMQSLTDHIRTHRDEKSYKCKECDQTFCQLNQLQVHMETHSEKKPYKSKQSERVLVSKLGLRHHMKGHGVKNPFNCNQCGKCFSTKSSLRQHMRIHTGEKPYICNQCGKRSFTRQNLEIHMRIHTGEKPFNCNECGQTFRQKTHLNRHMLKHTHTGESESQFKCNECGQSFLKKIQLQIHKKTHTDGKPFKSNASFQQRRHLQVHNLMHTDKKPFKCNCCQRVLGSKQSLLNHLRIHTGEKPFRCIICDRTFRSRSSLTMHKKRGWCKAVQMIKSELPTIMKNK